MEPHLLLISGMLTGAALIPFLSRRLRIPAAACEIAFGILLFNTVIRHSPQWFDLLKELGFIYLMFIAGMELDLGRMLKNGRTSAWMLAVGLLPFIALPLFFLALGLPLYLGIALSVVSVGIMLPVLRETGLIKTPAGEAMIDTAHIGELLSIAVLTGLHVYHEHGLSHTALYALVKLVGLMAVAVVFLKMLHLIAWWRPHWVARVMQSKDPVEEGIRTVIAVAFVGALLAQFAGVKSILGSFMAGAVFNSVFKNKGSFEEKINAVGFGFFTPFFFIGVGSAFDLQQLYSPVAICMALVLTAVIFVGKLPVVLCRGRFDLSARQSIGMALLMSAPLTMIVVTGTLGERMGLITPAMNSILVLTALFSSLLFPALFRFFVRASESG